MELPSYTGFHNMTLPVFHHAKPTGFVEKPEGTGTAFSDKTKEDCLEREKQGRMEELECIQGGGTEQRMCLMHLLARTDWMMMIF